MVTKNLSARQNEDVMCQRVGSSMGGFLDLGQMLHTEGCILSLTQSSHQLQSSHLCVIPDELQKGPGKDSAKILVWQGRREIGINNEL